MNSEALPLQEGEAEVKSAPRRQASLFEALSAARARALQEANALPTYRARQRRRAELGVGTLADYAWYGSTEDWERAKALARAGQEDLI